MTARGIGILFLLLFAAVFAIFSSSPKQPERQSITPAPMGPFRVDGARILDSRGRTFLMRGTQLVDFHPATALENTRSEDTYFGPYSATSLTSIRLRFNMNTVRILVDARESSHPEFYPRLEELIRRANHIELLAIVAAKEPTAFFWKDAAARLKHYPDVLLDLDVPFVEAVREAGWEQPVIVHSKKSLNDKGVIYAVATGWAADPETAFGPLPPNVPVLITGMELGLDDSQTCVPGDPAAVERTIDAHLDYFDEHRISWIVSSYRLGGLIGDDYLHHPTTLENGWDCGKPAPGVGPGRVIEAHLRSTWERGLFPVSTAGGPDLARGSVAVTYGPSMAQRDTAAKDGPQTSLGGMKVEIEDSRGRKHFAKIMWVSEGWGQVNYLIPEDAATGPATMTLVRDDNSRLSTNITIVDVAPGFWTHVSDHGVARGIVTQTFADGRKVEMPMGRCNGIECISLPIPVSRDSTTTVRLSMGGIHHAKSIDEIQVWIGDVRVPVLDYGADSASGVDYATIQIPHSLRNVGATDLIAKAHGRVSNAVRIRIGGTP